VAADLPALWEAEVLRPAVARAGVIRVIPGGQVLAALVAEAEAGRLPGIADRRAFFTDDIHFGDLGSLCHGAGAFRGDLRALSGRPAACAAGAPTGRPADPPLPETARVMQQVVWRVVSGYGLTGVAKG
jgi:hypothetical protein